MLKKFWKKVRQKKRWKQVRYFLPFLLTFALLLLLEAGYFVARAKLAHRLPYGIQIADTEFHFAEASSAQSEIELLTENFLQQPMIFTYTGETLEILPAEVDLSLDVESIIHQLKRQLINFDEISFPVTLNEKRLRRLLLTTFPELEYSPTDAKVYLTESGELEILQEKNGHQTDFEQITAQVKQNLGSFSTSTIDIEITEIPPTVFAKKLEPFRDELAKIVAQKVVLKKTEYERFEIDLAERLTWFDFKENGKLRVFLKKEPVLTFVEKELTPHVGELAHDVNIFQTFEGQIEFEGVAKSGLAVNGEEFFARISALLESEDRIIDIPFDVIPAPVKVTDELRERGFRELVGESITDYDGSPANRQHNIRVAADRLNGMIVEDGDEFSFLQRLGYINTRNGYKHELVIIEGDVTPEVGGGVCQVSTTFFRTALDAGLPITRHKPHSLKVAYYYPPGLDAAIYPGQADMRFVNDTGNPILIQTAVEGTQIRVNFFGTHDGREVEVSGPFYPNGEAITDLRYAGMRMFWTREIQKSDEETIEERYNAAYQFAPKHD